MCNFACCKDLALNVPHAFSSWLVLPSHGTGSKERRIKERNLRPSQHIEPHLSLGIDMFWWKYALTSFGTSVSHFISFQDKHFPGPRTPKPTGFCDCSFCCPCWREGTSETGNNTVGKPLSMRLGRGFYIAVDESMQWMILNTVCKEGPLWTNYIYQYKEMNLSIWRLLKCFIPPLALTLFLDLSRRCCLFA